MAGEADYECSIMLFTLCQQGLQFRCEANLKFCGLCSPVLAVVGPLLALHSAFLVSYWTLASARAGFRFRRAR